ncbi:LysR substrate-binding domain-containing protein [Brucella haematophila]|uniref:LysR family transcriptional regulator n=1 Tax=Brucella haematophila TaxID=419474 RepID=A0ABX1DPP0_9HYPH|nr:LysR substrate-binding domain-containing protein [Brucella haematophila]NKC04917.1 LysR family transcriptional regulator [Brucella haematophila]TMV04569.1 LysR family transcriptional regulator [Brucella haematophila]
MELRHLRYFLMVAQEGHFSRAAEKLHIVQPALSMQIRSLEEELDAALFTRTSRKVTLTTAGEILLPEARRILAQAERAKELVRKSVRGEIGSIRVGFSGNASFIGKLSDDLREFNLRFPEVHIALTEASPRQQVEGILAGELDVGYCPTFAIEVDIDLDAERIGSWPWMVAMSTSHPLASRSEISKADLLDETFVVYAAHGSETAQIDLLRRILGQEPNVAHSVGNTLTFLTMASAGLGLGLIPASLMQVALPGIAYRPLAEVNETADLVLLYRARETAGAVRAFLDLARRITAG